MAHPLQQLLDGFENFRKVYLDEKRELYEQLVRQGQSPKVLLIGCSDARVDPAILTTCEPGDLFVVRNVAAMVPPYQPDGHYHGTSAALEFAVRGLEVEHIVVLGHALCGGIRALLEGPKSDASGFEFLSPWVENAAEARDQVVEALKDEPVERQRRTLEQASVIQSLSNLMGFPWVRERVQDGRLILHGWYFDLTCGELFAYDGSALIFVPLRGRAGTPLDARWFGGENCSCGCAFNLSRFIATAHHHHQLDEGK